MTDTQSNHDWLLESIATANSIERLNLIRYEIAMDRDAAVDYTLNEAGMDVLREAWRKRIGELR